MELKEDAGDLSFDSCSSSALYDARKTFSLLLERYIRRGTICWGLLKRKRSWLYCGVQIAVICRQILLIVSLPFFPRSSAFLEESKGWGVMLTFGKGLGSWPVFNISAINECSLQAMQWSGPGPREFRHEFKERNYFIQKGLDTLKHSGISKEEMMPSPCLGLDDPWDPFQPKPFYNSIGHFHIQQHQ